MKFSKKIFNNIRSIDATELSQWRLFQRDLLKDENFWDCSTAKGSLLLFSTRLIHCPKLVQLRDEHSTPMKSTVAANFFIPDIEKFSFGRGSQRDQKSFSPDAISRHLSGWSTTGATGSDSFADWLKGEEKESAIGRTKIWARQGAIARKERKLGGDDVTSHRYIRLLQKSRRFLRE